MTLPSVIYNSYTKSTNAFLNKLENTHRNINVEDLHVLDRFPISLKQWDHIVKSTIYKIPLHKNDKIFDAGCGAGAYLHSLLRQYNNLDLEVSGVDFCKELINIAKVALPTKSLLLVRDVRDYSDIPSNKFDISISFGVFIYFDNKQDIITAFNELVRITKPGGYIMIGRVNSRNKLTEIKNNKTLNNYVKQQYTIDKDVFWNNIHDGVKLIDVKNLSELYNLHKCNDETIGMYRHCAYFMKL